MLTPALPALPVTGAVLITNTIVVNALESFANYSNDDTGEFSFYDLPEGPVRSKIITAISFEVVAARLTLGRDDPFHRLLSLQRPCISALRYPIHPLGRTHCVHGRDEVAENGLIAIPLGIDTPMTRRPKLTAELFDAAYKSWKGFVNSDTGFIVFVVAVIDAAVHAIILVFWLWLLPVRHRFLNRYELMVESRKKRKGLGSVIILVTS
jgi:hypothetical protein